VSIFLPGELRERCASVVLVRGHLAVVGAADREGIGPPFRE